VAHPNKYSAEANQDGYERAMDKALRKGGMMRNQYIEKIEQENLELRKLLQDVKRFVPAGMQQQIEAYFQKPLTIDEKKPHVD
jgi:hypothetical protein